LETSSGRVLVVEDSEEFRKCICSTLEERLELQVVGDVTDGLEAIQKAEALQPDLMRVSNQKHNNEVDTPYIRPV